MTSLDHSLCKVEVLYSRRVVHHNQSRKKRPSFSFRDGDGLDDKQRLCVCYCEISVVPSRSLGPPSRECSYWVLFCFYYGWPVCCHQYHYRTKARGKGSFDAAEEEAQELLLYLCNMPLSKKMFYHTNVIQLYEMMHPPMMTTNVSLAEKIKARYWDNLVNASSLLLLF